MVDYYNGFAADLHGLHGGLHEFHNATIAARSYGCGGLSQVASDHVNLLLRDGRLPEIRKTGQNV